MSKVNIDESDLDAGRTASGFRRDKPLHWEDGHGNRLGQSRLFDIEPGEIALCDYSNPPDISCRRTKTIGEVSDGYHTFDELYAHRIELFIALCREHVRCREALTGWATGQTVRSVWFNYVWRSLLHSDGSRLEGWFVMGIHRKAAAQITYHLPMARWDECGFAETLATAPEFDGHASADVLERLKQL